MNPLVLAPLVGVFVFVTEVQAQTSAGQQDTPGKSDATASDQSAAKSSLSAKVILLVRTPDDDAVMTRLHAELRATVWKIVELRPDERFGEQPLEELATGQGVSAALRVNAARQEIELWIAETHNDAESGADAISETLHVDDDGPDGRVMALRATEALRARGLDLAPVATDGAPAAQSDSAFATTSQFSPTPNSGEPVAPSEPPDERGTASTTPAPLRRVWLEFAPAALLSPGGLSPAIGGWAGLRAEVTDTWSFGALGFVPLSSSDVTSAEGSAEISTFIVGGTVDTRLLGSDHWQMAGGLGLGAALSRMNGKATPEYVGSSETVNTFAPFARVSAHFNLVQDLRIAARLMVGSTLPRVSVQFAQREVAYFGQPFAVATLGIEVPIVASTTTR